MKRKRGKYTYDVNSSGLKESFPLQLGNGKFLQSKSINVQISNLNDTYLNSIRNINWNVDSKAVLKAVELTKEEKDLIKGRNIGGYIPVIDKTLEE